jgi:DNA polymerase III subunit delta
MPSSPDVVLNDLKTGKYAPIYFLHGEESYFIDQIIDYIEANAIPEQDKGFNQVVLYGKDSPMNVILANARRFPMMANRQVVIVKEAQGIQGLGKEEIDELFIQYIQNPLPSTILVLAHKYKKLDGKKRLYKELDKKAIIVLSEKVQEYKLPPWIEKYIKSKGHTIDDKNAKIIAESIGDNLEVLTNEIDKMLINFAEPTTITSAIIEKYIGINKDYNNFELTKALSFRDVVKANKIIWHFSKNKKSHPLIVTITVIFNHFQRIFICQTSKNLSETELASKLKINPYFMKEYKEATRNYPLGKIIDNFGYIKEADLRSKGVGATGMEENEILKELIFKLMH